MKSIRKVLGVALKEASTNAYSITGKSINALPEYFLSVKVAEHLHEHFKSFTFSMEDYIPKMAKEIDMDISNEPEHFRLNGKADLILRSQKSKRLKHIVEFKRNLGGKGIKKDAIRLAWICANTPPGHRAEKNFLVAVAHKPESLFTTRTSDIKGWVKEEFGEDIKVSFEPVNLTSLKSTHKNGFGKELFGGVWEFNYNKESAN